MKTILIAGSKNLEQQSCELKREFAMKMGAAVVSEPNWRLITGGARGSGEDECTGGIDFHAALGAQEYIKNSIEENEKIITLHPRVNRTDLFYIGRVVLGRARSTRARRFELVSRADAVVVIEGGEGSEQIIEYSITADKVVIPIACYGGKAKELWNLYRQELMNTLKLPEGSPDLQVIEKASETPDLVVKACVNILKRLLKPLCFVIMPFKLSHSSILWESILKPVIDEAGFLPQRADFVHNVGQIIDDITHLLKEAHVVVADITGANPNVMYELGYAHALGKYTIIICSCDGDVQIDDKLPFDIRGMRIYQYDAWKAQEFRKELSILLQKI
ncbi:MAG: hypothetical protein JSV88_09505 [Candidatus Aminicenantes bacterium]|nr:MAG: hypothetical protein JSV88_09505 [Candidatus Aminicenantes bacterium]